MSIRVDVGYQLIGSMLLSGYRHLDFLWRTKFVVTFLLEIKGSGNLVITGTSETDTRLTNFILFQSRGNLFFCHW
jgi:hypothetical protein